MSLVQEAKRAALCHSPGGTPGSKELAGPGVETPRGDRGAQRTHQAHVEMQGMDAAEARSQDRVAAVEMPQVGTAEVAAGVAVARGIHRGEIAGVGAVADVD